MNSFRRCIYTKANLVDPTQAYGRSMRLKRKAFLKQVQDKKEADKTSQVQKEQEIKAAKEQKLADIARYKQSVLDSMSSMHSGVKKTPIDEILSKEPSSKRKPTGMEEWADILEAREQARLKSFILQKQQDSETRLESLLYLYHSASKFITYSNMDAKINHVLDLSNGDSESTDTFDSDSLFSQDSNLAKRREDALKLIMLGVHDNQKPSAEYIKDIVSNPDKMTFYSKVSRKYQPPEQPDDQVQLTEKIKEQLKKRND